jgi:flotillin
MVYFSLAIGAFVFIFITTVIILASRYKRCPSDQILVIYGKVAQGRSSRCLHGGGLFVWPLIQDYAYMSLTPITINIPLQNALSFQNIRINVPSTFTVGISTDPNIMTNAAERLLGISTKEVEEMAKEIIFGQLRLTVASLTIEQINQDRESFLEAIRKNVEPELNKIGLYLINVNITDITDESDYIESIGKKAAAEAINKAKVDVADQVKLGAIGEAQANREKEIRVAENMAESEKGKKRAMADQRIYVQAQEAEAVGGENKAKAEIANVEATLRVREAEAQAASEKGKKKAEADQRIYVQAQEAEAVAGENKAKAAIADSDAELAVKRAAALQRGEVAKRGAIVEIQKAQYLAEQERLNAQEIVAKEIEKRKIEIAAEAEAERIRREAKGEADGILFKYNAEAEGIQKLLNSKAAGYNSLVRSCAGDAKAAATLLMIEKLEEIVAQQVKAISSLKIDKITVWDSASGDGKGSSTSNFISSLIKSVPPLQDVASMAGVELPAYLGKMVETETPAAESPPGPKTRKSQPVESLKVEREVKE